MFNVVSVSVFFSVLVFGYVVSMSVLFSHFIFLKLHSSEYNMKEI